MLGSLRQKITTDQLRKMSDPKNSGLYIFLLIVLAISWSGVKTIQTNYELQKQIATIQQQNTVLQLQNENTVLQNQYYQTSQYLDLAARQDLGLAGPGEQVLLVSKAVAMKYVNQNLAVSSASGQAGSSKSRYIKNFDSWRDFLLGRNIGSD